MKKKQEASNISLGLMKKQGVSLSTLAKESIDLEEKEDIFTELEKMVKMFKQQQAEIDNLRDQIKALRQTTTGDWWGP